MKAFVFFVFVLILHGSLTAKEIHVAKKGNNNNPGTFESPLFTIQAAANTAKPGDVIIVHQGIYRELIAPSNGGESDEKRIVFQAAKGENVEVKGSEVINNWKRFHGNVWKVTIPNSFFGDYNPYKDQIFGHWFNARGRIHHTGEVYLNGNSLWEMAILENVLNPKKQTDKFDPEGSTYTWFCESDDENTYIYANFHDADPNQELVEINVRKSCFYPDTTGVNYITIRGFQMSQAATQWAPPTTEQIGLIGTNWSKGWIIENNTISDSKCSGITLGKYHDEKDNGSNATAKDYVSTIKRAIEHGWSKENIGHHLVKNNTIFNCEQTGICGSMGAIFSTIENNNIYNIWTKRQFAGAELGGIKIHAPVDMLIQYNRLVNCGLGLWLDWMAQGTRVTGNLCYQNTINDILVEVSHGPIVIDNNICLSELSLRDWSEGVSYVHNLFAGNVEVVYPQGRKTPYFKPHTVEWTDIKIVSCGDNRFYNNIFIGGLPDKKDISSGLKIYEKVELPMFVDYNVYLNGAKPFPDEDNRLSLDFNPEFQIENESDGIYLTFNWNKNISKMKTSLITTDFLGKAKIPDQKYKNRDGSNISIYYDFLKNKRNQHNPTAGPFEKPKADKNKIKVWTFK